MDIVGSLVNQNYTKKCDLLSLNYRELQSKAKELELPGNLKHNVLIKVIESRWSGNEDQVKKILANEKFSRAKKKAAKKLLQSSSNESSLKRVGRPRKKSHIDSLNSSGVDIGVTTPEIDYHGRRTVPTLISLQGGASSPPPRSTGVPTAHSIQQLLMDRSVPNAHTKHNDQTIPHSRHSFKSVHRSLDESSGGQVFMDTISRHISCRNVWEKGSIPCGNVGSGIFPQQNNGVDYSNFSYEKNFQVDDLDGNMNDYLPDLAGLLGNNMTGMSQSGPSSQTLGSSSQPSSHYPPIFLRQDLWPTGLDNNSTSYQQTQHQGAMNYPHQHFNHEYNWWNTPQQPYLPNPTGYSEEVIISETQNSDTLSAPENPDLVPAPYPTSTLLPENDNQVYWSKSEVNSTLTSATSLCSANQPLISNEISAERTGGSSMSHMRVSVVGTQEWTYEYSTSSLFSQSFLQHI